MMPQDQLETLREQMRSMAAAWRQLRLNGGDRSHDPFLVPAPWLSNGDAVDPLGPSHTRQRLLHGLVMETDHDAPKMPASPSP